MVCPYCRNHSSVTNSRHQKRTNSVWRRRRCIQCLAVWTTLETLQSAGTFKVTSNRVLVDFKPEMLLISLYEALRHRKTSESDAQYIHGTIVSKLQQTNQPVFTTALIANTAYGVLRNYDKLAADLYRAHHPLSD
jgi:transcriptional regulator NrdR family protein